MFNATISVIKLEVYPRARVPLPCHVPCGCICKYICPF